MKLKDFLVRHSFKMIISFTNQDMNDLIEANNTDEDEIRRLIKESDFKDELEAEYYISNIYPNDYFYDKFDIVLSKCTEETDSYYQINLLINSLCNNYQPYIKSPYLIKLLNILDDDKNCCLYKLYNNDSLISRFILIFGYYIKSSTQVERNRLCSNPIVELAYQIYCTDYSLRQSVINNRCDHYLSNIDLGYFCLSTDFLSVIDRKNPSVKECINFILDFKNSYDETYIGKMQLRDHKIYIDNTENRPLYTIKTIVDPYLDLNQVVTPEMFYRLTYDIIYPDSLCIFSKTYNTQLHLHICGGANGSKTIVITKSYDDKEIECMCTFKDSRFIFIFK